jgi:hypothetical protein
MTEGADESGYFKGSLHIGSTKDIEVVVGSKNCKVMDPFYFRALGLNVLHDLSFELFKGFG